MNTNLKTYKFMIDDSNAYKEAFKNFILNSHLSEIILRKNQASASEFQFECEEFYLKNDEFIFYFFKINDIFVMILFDKDTIFDDINNMKVVLKTYIDQYENKENYLETDRKEINNI
jgi:hypothetical protein